MAITQAVVLAAGAGTRLQPLTYTRPKCMIELAGKPILHHVLQNLKEAGVKEVVLIVKYKEETIRDYFEKNNLNLKITFITQGKKYGTAAAFAEAKGHINSTFFAVAGDVITTANALRELARGHEGKISALLKEVQNPQQYGIAEVAGGKIEKFLEKPKNPPKKALVNCSLYVMGPEIFEILNSVPKSSRGEYEMTDVITLEKPKAIITKEYWLDMGMPWQLFSANEFLLNSMREKRGKIHNSTVKGKIIMEEGSQILDSYVEGTVFIGKNTTIGPHAYIRGTTSIGNNCSIGDSTTIKNSIIFEGVNAKHLAYIGDSVIGANCNFGAGTQIANFRFDESSIKAKVKDVVIDTQRKKLGAIIGDDVKMGVLSSIMPGKIIGNNCWIGSSIVITENIEPNTHVQLIQNIKKTKIR